MKRKMGIYLLIFVGIFFLLIGIENAIKGIAQFSTNLKRNNEIKQTEKEYKQSEKYQTDIFLESSINQVIRLVQEEEYESIFSLLNDDYKDYLQLNDVSQLKEYLSVYLPNPKSARVVSYDSYSGMEVCRVLVEGDGSAYTRTIIIHHLGADKFEVIFDNIISIENMQSKYYKGNRAFTCKIKYVITKTDSTIFVTDITNNTNSQLNGSFMNTILQKTDGSYCNVINDLSSIKIEAKDTARINFEMDTSKAGKYPDVDLEIHYQGIDDTSYELDILLDELDDA